MSMSLMTPPPPAMVQDFSMSGSGYAAEAISYTPFSEWLKLYLGNAATSAKEQMADLHARCQARSDAHSSHRKSNARVAAQALDFRLRINEEADQEDDMKALLLDLVTRDGKCVKVSPGCGESEHRAKLLQDALYYELEKGSSAIQLRKALGKYVIYPFAGMKSVRSYKDGASCFHFEAINPHTFAVSDTGRPCANQFSLHEMHSLTKSEMRRAGFKNLDKLKSSDSSMGTKTRINDSFQPTNAMDVPGSKTYSVWKSWVAPPFLEATVEKPVARWNAAQLWQWTADWEIPPEYLFDMSSGAAALKDDGALLIIWHVNGEPLHVTTNYEEVPSEFPHKTTSFYEPSEEVFSGEALSERSADSFAGQDVLLNSWMDNVRMIANQSMFVSDRSSVPDEKLQQIYKPRGIVRFAGDDDPKQLFQFFEPKPIGNDILPLLQFFKNNIEQNGVSDVMRGVSRARTATENMNNNARGQTQVNQAGSRFVDEVLVPVCKSLVRMIMANYTPEDWYRVVGESGADMIGDPDQSNPLWVDRHFRVSGVGSFEYMNQSAKIAEIANLINVCAAFMPPDMGQRAMKIAFDQTRLSTAEIEFIMGSDGGYTDVLEEIAALKADPWTRIVVKPQDDHFAAIQAIMAVVEGDPVTGEPPLPDFMQYSGVKDYYTQHAMAIQAQMMQQIQMQHMQSGSSGEPSVSGGRTPKGNPKQIEGGQLPMDDIGLVRSAGQAGSPTDFNQRPGEKGMGAPVSV